MGGLILGVNTLYMLFCFLKQFALVGKGLKHELTYTCKRNTEPIFVYLAASNCSSHNKWVFSGNFKSYAIW